MFERTYVLLLECEIASNFIFRPVPDGKSVRLPLLNRPVSRPPDGNDEGLTERLVGEALALGRYMDERVVEAARREIAEGTP